MLKVTTSSREFFEEMQRHQERTIYLYGATKISDLMMELLERQTYYCLEGYLDRNPELKGLLRRGKYPILQPEQIQEKEHVSIIVGIESYSEVIERLSNMGQLNALILIPKWEMQDDRKPRLDFTQQVSNLRKTLLNRTDMCFISNDWRV